MKKNFAVIVKDAEGHAHVREVYAYDESGMPVMETKPDGRTAHKFQRLEPMDLRRYAIDTLAGRWKGEEAMTPGQAAERMRLHDKLAMAADGIVDVTVDECKLLLSALEKRQPLPVVLDMMNTLVNTDYKEANGE